MITYVEKAKLGAEVQDPAGPRRPSEERQERLDEHLGTIEVRPEDRLSVLHRVGVDLVERHRGVVHLQGATELVSESNRYFIHV